MQARQRLASIALVIAVQAASVAHCQDLWKEPQDTVSALTDSDLYAWRLFVALNWPANAERREADPGRAFGENATTVWESWKLTSGPNDEVFLAGGADPGAWLPGKARADRGRDFQPLPFQQRKRLQHGEPAAPGLRFDPGVSTQGNENHMNQDAFEFVRQHELYHLGGQEALFVKAEQQYLTAENEGRPVDFEAIRLDFPLNAKEIKAQWRPIKETEKNRYRWVEIANDKGVLEAWGLTAIHITTKDLPNWFWTTFEHVDNPSREGAEPWIVPTRDRAAGPDGYPEKLGIKGTRWENYRLRGTQVDFTDPTGAPTILANSQIEQGFQTSSSCITCHARAAIGARVMHQANRLSIFDLQYPAGAVIGNVGILDQSLFVHKTFTNPVAGELKYLPLDFVWSFMRAKRKVDVTRSASPTFTADVRPLFRPRDVNAMRQAFDLTVYADVKKHAQEILTRLEDGSMPCDNPWPPQDVDLFRNWVKNGMPE